MAKGDAEMAALVAAVDGDVEFEMALGELVGRMRRRIDAAIRDQEAATLLPMGWRVVAERFDVSKATVYNMNQRAQSRRKQVA